MSTHTYADNVVAYAQAGWPAILPVPARDKFPPPVGFTGAEGRDTDPLQLVAWAGSHASHSIALRMPEGVIGIDVDQYVKKGVQKRGAETLAACEERWGPLPATWTSTARGGPDHGGGPGASGIRFFRVPGRRYVTKLTSEQGGGGTSDVEIIQRHHRYAVVWPSPHAPAEEGGEVAIYRWYDPQGALCDAPPKPGELPELPQAWVDGLTEGATEAGPAAADRHSGEQLLDQLLEDWRPECADITSARLQALDELGRADAGSRHDTMTARAHHLVQLAAHGHTGVAAAVAELRQLWANLTAGEERAEELERMLLTSARKAVTVVGSHQVPRDPCLFAQGFAGVAAWPAPAPGDPGADDPELQIVEPPRWAGVREVIGTAAFDPGAELDQALAERVLERTYPALRYAYDSNGWLLRVPDRWELHGRLSPWAVAQVAGLMPVGNPEAEKGSDEHARSKRRARLMSTAGARAVAGKMDDLVSGGMHPASVALSGLDADPEVLWAGGLPWSLRASLERPTVADLDPATPHQHSAAVTPERRNTPLWDAFLAAVWPDPELRAWAVRVLSIAVTGYSDRALPILLGETGRGKTQVVNLIMSVLGSYGHAANPKLLNAGANEHDTIVFALKGRRLSFIDEAPGEAKAGQEKLKQLTGGGELTARQMNQDPITFRPTHTLVLTANDEPLLTDPAVRSRARLIPCEGDPELVRQARAAIGPVSSAQWRAEAPGVLATLLSEAASWLADPTSAAVTSAPERIQYLAEHIGAEQDPVSVWVSEETEPFEAGTASRELYQGFTASCLRNNVRRDQIPSETKWGRALTRLGYPGEHTRQGKIRQLRIRSGSFLPGMAPSPTHDSVTGCDGLVTGLTPNPSQAKPQVNPSESVSGDGCDGLNTSLTYAHAHMTRAGGPDLENPSTRHTLRGGEGVETASDLHERPLDPSGSDPSPNPSPAKAPRKKAERTAEATQRAAEKRETARLEAIAAAAGARVELPALVTRDGAVRTIALADADTLLGTVSGAPGGELTVDVENTGYPLGHADYALRTIQLGNEHFAVVLEHGPADQADVVRRHLAAAPVLHAHSATADLVPLADAGLLGDGGLEDAWSRMHDTVVLAKLADPASTGSDPGLKQISHAMLGAYGLSKSADAARAALFKAGRWLTDTKVTTDVTRSGWANVEVTAETMIRYAASDVLDDAAIARRLPQPEPHVLERERTAQRMTARVAHVGLRVDGEHVDRLLVEHRGARARHSEAVQAFGIDNPGSNAQVAAVLEQLGAGLPRTATGRPSVAEAVLLPLRAAPGPVGELAAAVLDYRHHDTAIGTFLEPYHQLVTRGDGRARPTVYTLGADTGRMSCVRPNLQQVPREGGFRACITADPGHLLVSADFAGVELRVAAALSGDRNLRAILADPERDVHWEIARLAFGAGATKSDRYAVKRGVFGRIYGGGVGAIAAGVGVSEAVAQTIIDALDTMLPELSEWSRLVRDSVKSGRTQFQTYAGRVAHLPADFPHKAPNYCIQGTARELLIDALLRWADTPWGGAVLLPVHDELVVMVPEDQAHDATAALEAAMTSELFGVPIKAEASTPSYAWSDSV